MKLKFPRRTFKNTQISNFMKIRPLGAELFLGIGTTDMTKLLFAFRNFANAPKNVRDVFVFGYTTLASPI